jgi:cytochrome c5
MKGSEMKLQKSIFLGLAALALGAPMIAGAYEGDWKRGDVYYRMVCTDCHKTQPCGPIAPNSRTRAEWTAYLEAANGHAKGKDNVKHYMSKTYRASIASKNKAAAKFADVPDEELFADIKALLMRSAKDGDAPTGCR